MEIKKYLFTGQVPKIASINERNAFILQLVKFNVIVGELYRLGTDSILKRCVPMYA